MKNLYVFTRNNGDGSSSICATFDGKLMEKMQTMYDNDELDFETFCDGDGFHYETWTVPDECTAKSMGFWEFKDTNIR